MILHSQILGAGKPVLILHGFLGMSDNWKSIGLKVADLGYEVHLLDLRNHGHSFHSNEFTIELMVADVQRYIWHHHLKQVILMGHSMGGKVAMEYALHYSKDIAALIVVDIAPKYYAPHHQLILAGLLAIDNTKLSSREEADTILQSYVPEPAVRQFLLKNLYWVNRDELGLRLNVKVLYEQADAIGAAVTLNTPFYGSTLFLRGQLSRYIRDEDKESIERLFPRSQLITIPLAGHWLHSEQPQKFLQAITFFISNLP